MSAAAARPTPVLVRDVDALAIAAERSTLGAMMLDADAVATVRGIVSACDFAQQRHAAAFAAALAVADRGETVAPLSVAAELERRGAAADLNFLVDLAESTLTGAGIEHDAHLVVEHANRRRIVAGARAALELAGEGREASALAEVLRPAVDGAVAGRVAPKFEPFKSAFELGKRPRRPLVWGAGLPAGGLAMLFGSYKSCKSFAAYALAVAVADGQPFLGFDVAQGTALVLAGEGGESIADRIRAATTCARVATAEDELHKRLRIRTTMPNILDAEGLGDLARAIEATDTRPALLVVDTWARLLAAAGIDPLDNHGAMLVVDALRRLQERFGLAVLVLAHTGHGDGDRAMGAKALAGACDFVFSIKRRDNNPLPRVRIDFAGPNLKNKDGREADPLDVDLAEVVVGDRDGKPVTSCRIDQWRPADAAQPKAERKPRAREVLILAAQEAGRRGFAFAEAAAAVGSKSTASEALAKLVGAGLLERFDDGAGERWRLA